MTAMDDLSMGLQEPEDMLKANQSDVYLKQNEMYQTQKELRTFEPEELIPGPDLSSVVRTLNFGIFQRQGCYYMLKLCSDGQKQLQ